MVPAEGWELGAYPLQHLQRGVIRACGLKLRLHASAPALSRGFGAARGGRSVGRAEDTRAPCRRRRTGHALGVATPRWGGGS
jgi:hypothetical protein